MKLSREFYIPKKYDEVKSGKGYDIYINNDDLIAFCFGGKRSKPDYNYRYRTKEQMDESINNYIKNIKERAVEKTKRNQARKDFKHTLKVGDILSSLWGYDQTNVDFYQVTALHGDKMVSIRSITSKSVSTPHFMSDTVIAVKDSFIKTEKPMRKRVSQGNYVRLNSYSSASPWSGKPITRTWGH